MSQSQDDELIARFVETCCKLDDGCWTSHENPPPDELNAEVDPDDWNRLFWKPASILISTDDLAALYHQLPAKLPPLYERLIATWRWLEVYLHKIRLFENPPGPGLIGLTKCIFREPVFVRHLIGSGFIPFAFSSGDKSTSHTYDPVCFDTNHRNEDGDCPIRVFEHEAMLSLNRIGESWVLWPSFRGLVIDTIDAAS